MRFLDKVFGRTAPAPATLDALFALPGAALTLQAATGLRPTGLAAVAYREAEGAAAAGVRRDVTALLAATNGPQVEPSVDSFGYTWLLLRSPGVSGAAVAVPEAGTRLDDGAAVDVSGLVTDLHAVNSSLVDAGFGPTLLCSTLGFVDPDGRHLGLVYLFKRGTFYPFAPGPSGPTGATATGMKGAASGQTRDSAYELQVRAALGVDLPVEPDLARWFPLWGAPAL